MLLIARSRILDDIIHTCSSSLLACNRLAIGQALQLAIRDDAPVIASCLESGTHDMPRAVGAPLMLENIQGRPWMFLSARSCLVELAGTSRHLQM